MLLNRQKFWPRSRGAKPVKSSSVHEWLLDGVRAGFTRANAQRLLQLEHPHFPIAGFPSPRHVTNRFHYLLCNRIVHREFYLGLGHKVDPVFSAAIAFHSPKLSSVSLYFGDGNALNADVRHRLPNLVHLEGLDDGSDQLHALIPAFTR